MPNVIDSSFLNAFLSGTNTRLFISALSFFDLTNERDEPTNSLKQLVNADINERKSQMKSLLEQHYSNIFELELTRATPKQFEEALDQYGLGGDTKRKARAFLIQAIQYAGIPMSEIITRRTRTSKPRKRTNPNSSGTTSGTSKSSTVKKNVSNRSDSNSSASTITINLRNDERVTLAAEVNIMTIHSEDRDFLLGLVDQIKEHDEAVRAWKEGEEDDSYEDEEDNRLF